MPIDAPIHTSAANLPRVLNAGLPLLLVFWRRESAACEQLNPVLDRLARTYANRGLVVKLNVADEPQAAQRYGVAQVPTIIALKDGTIAGTVVGSAAERDLAGWFDYLIAGGARPTTPPGPTDALGSSEAANTAGQERPSSARTPRPADRTSTPAASPVVLTDATFDRAIRSQSPVLVDFWAEWCGPCKAVAPAVATLAGEFAGRAVIAKLNVDENPKTAARFNVMSIPTLLIFRNGQMVDQIVGAQPLQVLRNHLARYVG